MKRIAHLVAAAAACLSLSAGGAAAAGSPDDVLVETAKAKLTRGDYEADLLRLSPELRNPLASDPKRLTILLNNMIIAKTLAAEARQAGLDRDPQVVRLIALETDRLLAQLQMQHIETQAGEDFDAKASDFLVKARERYILDKDKYRVPEQVKASHMLFDPKKDSPEAALARAQDARAKLLAGTDFGELARKVSDEPAAKTTGGELGWFGPGRLDPDFTKAAYAMKTPGEISEPLRTRFGYHVIRYEDRRPERQQTFDEVKDGIMAQLRATYVTEQKEAKLASIRSDPNMKIDQAAVDGLVYHPDPQLFKPAPPPPTN
jgi:peptidyl-prolyl cis-trans isomerase C